jgi:adenylate cyclase
MTAMPPLPQARTPVAILCADVHGYSRMMARNEERTYELVNRAINLIRSRIGDYGGRVANVAGDGVMALVGSASQALQFAFAIQREFRDGSVWNVDDDPIAFRIGINFGEVFFGEGNVQGHSVNIAARIQTLARPGGICITDLVQRAAPDSVGGRVRPLGLKYLKNIDEPVVVFAIDINGAEISTSLLVPAVSGSLRPSRPMAVVEAFQAASGSLDETYLALAMSESLTQALSKFNWLSVKEGRSSGLVAPVLADSSAGSFIADRDYVVTGRILRMRGNLRLLAKLHEHRIGESSGLAVLTCGSAIRSSGSTG